MPEPVITSKNLPPSQQPNPTVVKEATTPHLPDSMIVAKPLRAPNFINLKPVNPNLSLYWGNRSVGEKESGLRYDQLIAMGFVPAAPVDVKTSDGKPCPLSIQRDGRIMYGDLILLKIPREDYVGALKWNAESAAARVRRLGQKMDSGNLSHQDTNTRESPSGALDGITNSRAAKEGKIRAYIPNLAETDARTADNTGPYNLADPPKGKD